MVLRLFHLGLRQDRFASDPTTRAEVQGFVGMIEVSLANRFWELESRLESQQVYFGDQSQRDLIIRAEMSEQLQRFQARPTSPPGVSSRSSTA